MEERKLQGATLLSWTLQIYNDSRRGIPQSAHEAAIARSMQYHKEWWDDWEAFEKGAGVEDSATTNRLIHIHHDAAVSMQIDTRSPKGIRELYDALREKGFTEFESVHTIAVGLTEEFARSRERGEDFDSDRYVSRATQYAREALSRPNLTRIAKAKAY